MRKLRPRLGPLDDVLLAFCCSRLTDIDPISSFCSIMCYVRIEVTCTVHARACTWAARHFLIWCSFLPCFLSWEVLILSRSSSKLCALQKEYVRSATINLTGDIDECLCYYCGLHLATQLVWLLVIAEPFLYLTCFRNLLTHCKNIQSQAHPCSPRRFYSQHLAFFTEMGLCFMLWCREMPGIK